MNKKPVLTSNQVQNTSMLCRDHFGDISMIWQLDVILPVIFKQIASLIEQRDALIVKVKELQTEIEELRDSRR